ncbi:uncharacterized protein B0H18DRAFT_1116891 [Fomitopsis serialis]|uniref:uncharacterized protein n=1 Tax=Fomitopsis serialis TaxID=139415 RepID=UPI002007EF27|nr:uncharacterized protein B0H18DRAFT_1116891 [Neoantrodia serialis]KAH9930784.1 hypothetical protein B0H18DRAFT_1116891 [Neoantrodia serialis]
MQQPQPSTPTKNGTSTLPSVVGTGRPLSRPPSRALTRSPPRRSLSAIPHTSSSGNPWVSPRATSPVERTGISYASMAAKPRPTTPILSSASQAVPASTAKPAGKIEAVAEAGASAKDGKDSGLSSTTTQVVVKVEEEEASLDPERTRSGKQPAASKLKNKKQCAKKSAKAAGKQPANIGIGLPAQDDQPVSNVGPSSRSISDVRKCRRISTDVDGESAPIGTIPKVQDTPTTPARPPAATQPTVISLISPAGSDNDPPAVTTSDLEADDVEMRDPDDFELSTATMRMFYGLDPNYTADSYHPRPIVAVPAHLFPDDRTIHPPHVWNVPGSSERVQQYIESQHVRERNPYVLAVAEQVEGDIEDLYASAAPPDTSERHPSRHLTSNIAAPQAVRPPPRSFPSVGISMGDHRSPSMRSNNMRREPTAGPSRSRAGSPRMIPPRSPPNRLHPHPVHYAPGPFPNFPDPDVSPVPAYRAAPPTHDHSAAPPAPYFPAGPIAPLEPAHGPIAPRSMTRTPPGGWPIVQGDDPFWPYANIQAEQLVEWTTKWEPCVLIHFVGRSAGDKGNYARQCTADTILKKVFDIPDAVVTQPIPANPQPRPNAEPIFYRVDNITVAQRDRLLRKPWASTIYGTFGVVPAPHEPPTFIGGWRYPQRLGTTSATGMADVIRKDFEVGVLADHAHSLLVSDIRGDGRWRHLTVNEAHTLIVQSVRVRLITVREGRDDDEELIALLYIESPTSDAAEWINFRDAIRHHVFGSAYAGPPELVTSSFYCMYCHAADHPTSACTLPSIPGWLGPSMDEVRTMLANDRRNQGELEETVTVDAALVRTLARLFATLKFVSLAHIIYRTT